MTAVLNSLYQQTQLNPTAPTSHYLLYRLGGQKSLIKVDMSSTPCQFWYYDLLGRPATRLVKETIDQFLLDKYGELMAYSSKDLENQFNDFYRVLKHEIVVATAEPDAPFPAHASTEMNAKYELEAAIKQNAWAKLTPPTKTTIPNFKDVLPPLSPKQPVSTLGWLRNNLFKTKPPQSKATTPEQRTDSNKTPRKG